jgi:hypothetical protein
MHHEGITAGIRVAGELECVFGAPAVGFSLLSDCLAFSHNNKFITLRGVLAPPLESIKQLTQDTVPPEI